MLKNETIHCIKNESSPYKTYLCNNFFTAKRGPLMSAHMKYIPIYQQTADGDTDLVTTLDFCLSSKTNQPLIKINLKYYFLIGLSYSKLI